MCIIIVISIIIIIIIVIVIIIMIIIISITIPPLQGLGEARERHLQAGVTWGFAYNMILYYIGNRAF